MSINTSFYNGSIRRYVIAFGNLFDGIKISRPDSSGNVVQTLEVPLSYAPKDKVLVRLDQSKEFDKNRPAISLPRMAFEMINMTYDASRKINSSQEFTGYSSDFGKLKTVYSPIPYNLEFELYINVRNVEDGLQIVEQILPFFKPELTLSVQVLPTLDINLDTPFILNSVNSQDNYEGDFTNRRSIIWTLNFTVKASVFGPVDSGKNIIKTAKVKYHSDVTDSALFRIVRETLETPALLANGSPTSNSSASIPLSQISANSNYGISTNIEDLI
jgi:hypothetical protein